MIRKGNVTIGLQTRFGPDWTGIRCGARTQLGGECQRPAVKKTGRCTRHGGKSTGPRTQAGLNKIAALHTTHGKYTKAKRQEAQKRAEVGRRVRAEIKLIETCLIEQGVLDRNWCKDWPMNKETELDGYEVEINGEWYEADKNGNLTEGGKRAKQAIETPSSDDGGGC